MATTAFHRFCWHFPSCSCRNWCWLFGSQHHPPRATTNTTLQHHRHNPTKLLASVSTFAFLAEAAGEVGAGFHYTTTPQSQKPIVLCKYAGRKCRKSRETIAIECTNFKLCRGRQICAHSAKDGWTIELVSTFARQPTILKSPEFGVGVPCANNV